MSGQDYNATPEHDSSQHTTPDHTTPEHTTPEHTTPEHVTPEHATSPSGAETEVPPLDAPASAVQRPSAAAEPDSVEPNDPRLMSSAYPPAAAPQFPSASAPTSSSAPGPSGGAAGREPGPAQASSGLPRDAAADRSTTSGPPVGPSQMKPPPNPASQTAKSAQSYRSAGASRTGAAAGAAAETAAREGIKKGVDSATGGAGTAASKVPGTKQLIDGAAKVTGKATAKVTGVATSAAGGIVLLIMALIGSVVGIGVIASSNAQAVLTPPMPTVEQCAMLPEGWCQVLWSAQKSTEGSANPVPWSLLAGIALAATDYGKTSPTDSIDRDPGRPSSAAYASFALNSGLTGSAGIPDSEVMLIGDSLSVGLGPALQAALKRKKVSLLFEPCGGNGSAAQGVDPTCIGTSAVSRTSSQLVDVLESTYAEQAPSTVVVDIGTNGLGTFERDVDKIVQLLPGSQVYFLTLHTVGSSRSAAEAERGNKVLRQLAAANPNVHVIDVSASATAADLADGIHLKSYTRRAQIVADAIASGGVGDNAGSGSSASENSSSDSSSSGTSSGTSPGSQSSDGDTLTPAAGRGWPLKVPGIDDPSSKVWGGQRNGQILLAPEGTPVLAVADGVIQSVSTGASQFGKEVVLRVTDAAGDITDVSYRQVARVDVTQGQKVKLGQRIAAAGKSGDAAKSGVTVFIASGDSSAAAVPLSSWVTDTDPVGVPQASGGFAAVGFGDKTPADLSNSMPSPCPVAVATPAIEGPEGSQGPFLLSAELSEKMRDEGEDPQDACQSALVLAQALSESQADSELYSQRGRTVEQFTDYAADLVANSGAVVTPDAEAVDCAVVPDDLPRQTQIAWIFRCEAAQYGAVNLVTNVSDSGKFSVASPTSGLDQLIAEAVGVSSGFSNLGRDRCRPSDEFAGAFPLTQAQAEQAGIDRCDFEANVRLAAQIVVSGEAEAPKDRAGSDFRKQAGGWSRLPYVLGDADRFYAEGPWREFNPSRACLAVLDPWMTHMAGPDSPLSQPIDTVEGLAQAFAEANRSAAVNPLRSDVCDVSDRRAFFEYVANWVDQSNVEVPGGTVAVGDVSVRDDLTDGVVMDNPDRVELFPGTTAQGVLNLVTFANAEQDLEATAVPGTDSLVPRLSVSGLAVSGVPAVRDLPPLPSLTNYAASAAATSAQLAGGPVDFLWVTPDVIGGAVGYTGGEFGGRLGVVIAAAKAQIGVPYVSGGGTSKGPSQPGTCFTAGSPGGCTGVGVGSPPGFDCSKFTMYAYAQAEVTMVGYSVTQWQAASITGKDIEPRKVPIPDTSPDRASDTLLPGDLVFWGYNGTGGGQPTTHVALYIGNGEIIEAGNPIGIQKLSDAIAGDSRAFMDTATRVFSDAELRASMSGVGSGGSMVLVSGTLLQQASALKDTSAFPAGAVNNASSRMGEWMASDRTVVAGTPRASAVGMMTSAPYNWSVLEWACLDRLWWHESGWDPQTTDAMQGTGYGELDPNKTFGIPQANPASKMASAGPDWRTNPETQIKWGLTYIKQVYGSPCAAWDKWVERARTGKYGWY